MCNSFEISWIYKIIEVMPYSIGKCIQYFVFMHRQARLRYSLPHWNHSLSRTRLLGQIRTLLCKVASPHTHFSVVASEMTQHGSNRSSKCPLIMACEPSDNQPKVVSLSIGVIDGLFLSINLTESVTERCAFRDFAPLHK